MSGDGIQLDEVMVDEAIDGLRTLATEWAAHGSAMTVEGVGPDVRDAVDAALATWLDELSVASEATSLAADRVQGDRDAFFGLDAQLAASAPDVAHVQPAVPVAW